MKQLCICTQNSSAACIQC